MRIEIEPLLIDEKKTTHLIQFEDVNFRHSAFIIVWEVTKWDNDWNPIEKKIYLKARCKADGFFHFWFGEKDGYILFRDKKQWENHILIMDSVYVAISEKIENFKG